MTNLSPAAQAVLDAFLGDAEYTGLQMDDTRENVAAALRATSARLMDLVGYINHPKYLEGIEASSDFLDQIATELEALPND